MQEFFHVRQTVEEVECITLWQYKIAILLKSWHISQWFFFCGIHNIGQVYQISTNKFLLCSQNFHEVLFFTYS